MFLPFIFGALGARVDPGARDAREDPGARDAHEDPGGRGARCAREDPGPLENFSARKTSVYVGTLVHGRPRCTWCTQCSMTQQLVPVD